MHGLLVVAKLFKYSLVQWLRRCVRTVSWRKEPAPNRGPNALNTKQMVCVLVGGKPEID